MGITSIHCHAPTNQAACCAFPSNIFSKQVTKQIKDSRSPLSPFSLSYCSSRLFVGGLIDLSVNVKLHCRLSAFLNLVVSCSILYRPSTIVSSFLPFPYLSLAASSLSSVRAQKRESDLLFFHNPPSFLYPVFFLFLRVALSPPSACLLDRVGSILIEVYLYYFL